MEARSEDGSKEKLLADDFKRRSANSDGSDSAADDDSSSDKGKAEDVGSQGRHSPNQRVWRHSQVEGGQSVSASEKKDLIRKFMDAIGNSSDEVRQSLQSVEPAKLNALAQERNAIGFSLLHEAARFADLEMAMLLLAHGATELVDVYSTRDESKRQEQIAAFRAEQRRLGGNDAGELVAEIDANEPGGAPLVGVNVAQFNANKQAIAQLEQQGVLPSQSPLTYAVRADFINGNEWLEDAQNDQDIQRVQQIRQGMIEQNNQLIIQLVEYSHSPVDALCAAVECGDNNMLSFLLTLPKIRRAINTFSRENNQNPVLMSAHFLDLHMLQLLFKNGADPRLVAPSGNTILHEAVLQADMTKQEHIDFIRYLLGPANFGLLNLTNAQHQTAFILACAQRNIPLIRLLGEFNPDSEVGINDSRSALHMAARYGNSEIVDLLLEISADQSERILSEVGNLAVPNPFQIALDEERKERLRSQMPAAPARQALDNYDISAQHDWASVQRSILKFAHRPERKMPNEIANIRTTQFHEARTAINQIQDPELRKPFTDLLNRYEHDYTLVMQGNDQENDVVIDKNIKILGLVNELRIFAGKLSDGSSKAEMQQAKVEFDQGCRFKLYDDNIKTFYAALIGAVIGFIAGVIIGGLIGAATTGGPGTLIAVPTAADVGVAVGSAAGVAIVGGAAGAAVGISMVDTLKYQFGLFKVNWAVNSALKSMVEPEPAEDMHLALPQG